MPRLNINIDILTDKTQLKQLKALRHSILIRTHLHFHTQLTHTTLTDEYMTIEQQRSQTTDVK